MSTGNEVEVIDWLDHYCWYHPSWDSLRELHERLSKEEDFVVRTYGKVVWEDEHRICLISEERRDTDLGEELFRNVHILRKELVVRRQRLQLEESPNE